MKASTRRYLLNRLKFGNKTIRDVSNLFDIYANLEIRTKEDLFRDHKPFFELIRENKSAFEPSDLNGVILTAHRRVNALRCISGHLWLSPEKLKHQECFSEEVKEIISHDKSKKILEIGSGVIPYSSILLGEDGYDISSIDQFYLPPKCLERMHVKSYRQMFSERFDVSSYDVVVGRRPCTAIRSMVTACTDQRVPYFMRLCTCSLPSDGDYTDWWPILREIDKDIEFYGAYAFNFTNSNFDEPKDIERIVELDSDMSKI